MILICEDNKLAMKTLSMVLHKEGYKSETAQDGLIALDKLMKNNYELILMDIHLPFHSGLELVKYIRADLKKKTPVIILSAFSDPQLKWQAGEMGIDAYIEKPFDPSELLKKIKSVLKK